MKYKASRDLPNFMRKYKTTSPTELRKIILSQRNKAITEQAITTKPMMFLTPATDTGCMHIMTVS